MATKTAPSARASYWAHADGEADLRSRLAALGDPEEVGLDTETGGLNPWRDPLALVQVATRGGGLLLAHVRGGVPGYLADWISDRGRLVAHNAHGFDAYFLHNAGVDVGKPAWYDTLIGEQCCLKSGRRDVRVSLSAALERRYSSKKARKSELGEHRWMAPDLTDEELGYASNDTTHLLGLMDRQWAYAAKDTDSLGRRGTMTMALENEVAVIPATLAMTINGLPINQDQALEVRGRMERDAKILKERIQGELGPILLSSAPQLLAACQMRGMPIVNTTADSFTTVTLENPFHAELAQAILDWKKVNTFATKYKDDWFGEHVEGDGRVHAKFWQLGTDTGRYTSSNPNLQQVDKKYRYMYEAPPGWKIVTADYSQIEVRMAAFLAGDTTLITALGEEDIHRAIAAQMFGVEYGAVSKEQRQLAKACVFTLLFGGGPATIYEDTKLHGGDLGMAGAEELVRKFFATYTELNKAKWWAIEKSRGYGSISVVLPTGLQRSLEGYQKTPQIILNTRVQGSAAAGLKFALQECVAQGLHGRLCATVHDELVACVPNDEANAYADALREAMVKGMEVVTRGVVPIEVDTRVSQAWT